MEDGTNFVAFSEYLNFKKVYSNTGIGHFLLLTGYRKKTSNHFSNWNKLYGPFGIMVFENVTQIFLWHLYKNAVTRPRKPFLFLKQKQTQLADIVRSFLINISFVKTCMVHSVLWYSSDTYAKMQLLDPENLFCFLRLCARCKTTKICLDSIFQPP